LSGVLHGGVMRLVKHVLIGLPPLLLFVAVVVAGAWWTSAPSSLLLSSDAAQAETASAQAAPCVAWAPPVRASSSAAARPSLVSPPPRDPRVPAHLDAPLRAVAADVSLCVSQRLPRDRGPISVDVVFTPVPGGGFAQGTRVFTNWHDADVEACVVEVFEETTFMPTDAERFEPSEFVFHFPDDAMTGLLGLEYSPFH
jgi:hypothetical protein